MDPHLRSRLVNWLCDLPADAVGNYNDPQQVLPYLEENYTSLEELWRNVETNLESVTSRKDSALVGVSLKGATLRLERVKGGTNDGNSAKKRALEEVLKLLDEALVNADTSQLASVYCFRAEALWEYGDSILAMEAIDRAIVLEPFGSAPYIVTKATYLESLGLPRRALRLLARAQAEIDYPRQAEEAGFLGRHLEEMKQLTEKQAALKAGLKGTKIDEDDEEEPEVGVTEKPATANFSIDYRLAIQRTQRSGRGLTATQGAIAEECLVLKEAPCSLVLFPEVAHRRCNYCACEVINSFHPCEGCSSTVYCDPKCARRDWEMSHAKDCGLLNYWTSRSKSMTHVFKMINRLGVWSVLEIAQAQEEEELGESKKATSYGLEEYLSDAGQRKTPECNKSRRQVESAFRAFTALVAHRDALPLSYLGSHLVNSIEASITACLVQGLPWGQLTHAQLVSLIAFSFTTLRRILLNCFRWSDSVGYEPADSKEETEDVASIVCLLASVVNHSCEPNCEWAVKEGKLCLFTRRHISPGEELTISYGPIASDHIESRQYRLLSGYYFLCSCEACLDDARLLAALQCSACPGPVLVEERLYDVEAGVEAKCLACCAPLSGTAEKMSLVRASFKQLSLARALFSSGNKASALPEAISVVKGAMAPLRRLLYGRSHALLEALYTAAQLCVSLGGPPEHCLEYGAQVDAALPLGSISGLLVLRPPSEKRHRATSTTDLNIEHLQFWTGLYRSWIQASGCKEATVWEQMNRFGERLQALLEYSIVKCGKKLHRKKKEMQKTSKGVSFEADLATDGLKHRIELLRALLEHKQAQLKQTKVTYGVGVL